METNKRIIHLAGGCFWGVEKYFSLIKGVLHTEAGYANGHTDNPNYTSVCTGDTGFAEAVSISYDSNVIALEKLLDMFYQVIDPTSINRQGNDIGSQYRSGIYYTDDSDLPVILESISNLQNNYSKAIAIEVKKLENFYLAEQYHQKYLDKNPGGYCHIGSDKFILAKNTHSLFQKPDIETLKKNLTGLQFKVTQHNATEPPFDNEFNDHTKEGIYVDITTGEPLFLSSDKYDAGCGWPSFTKAVEKDSIKEVLDLTHGMFRTEVRSVIGDSHLGHVFTDGPKDKGGLRYCINSASLRFIPKDEMQKEGYGEFLNQLENKK